jgi:hypothetical protein
MISIPQAQTMEMMYGIIADELRAMNIEDAHPQDYLNFFCLGNREEPVSNGSLESDKSTDKSAAVILHFFLSFPLKKYSVSSLSILIGCLVTPLRKWEFIRADFLENADALNWKLVALQ